MKNFLIILSFTLLGISISSCTKAEIEKNANEAGNVVGKTLKGVSSGFIDGLKGKDEQIAITPIAQNKLIEQNQSSYQDQ